MIMWEKECTYVCVTGPPCCVVENWRDTVNQLWWKKTKIIKKKKKTVLPNHYSGNTFLIVLGLSYILRHYFWNLSLRTGCLLSERLSSKRAQNNKHRWGYGEKGTLVHCWWECKLVQPLWKTVCSSTNNWKQNYHMIQQFYSWVYIKKNCH